MCSQSEDTATNSHEAAGAIAMCINCLPPSAEVLGNNLEPTPNGVSGTNISGALREPMTQPARTHGYFIQSQNKRQDGAPPMVGGPKCPSEMKGPKPNPGSQNKTKEQAGGALGGDKRVPSQKKSGRGWANKARVQGSSPPTNDSMTPSQTRFGRGLSKKPKAQVGWSLSLSPAVLHKNQLDDPDIGPLLMERVRPETFWPRGVHLKPCNQALLELLVTTANTRWHADAPFCEM